MRKKKGAMATAASSNKTPPAASTPKVLTTPKLAPAPKSTPSPASSRLTSSLSPKLSSTANSVRSITPSPVLINRNAMSPTSPPPMNGSLRDGAPAHLHNGKPQEDATSPGSDIPKALPPPTPPLSPASGLSSPRSPRPDFAIASTSSSPGGARPVSAVSSVSVVSSALPPASGVEAGKGKVTVGEIVAQIEARSAALMRHEDLTRADAWTDLSFLAQQSRYNSDMHVRRKLYTRLVDHGLLSIFLRVFRAVHARDFLSQLAALEDDASAPAAETASLSSDLPGGSAAGGGGAGGAISGSMIIAGGSSGGGGDKDSLSFIDDKDDGDDRSIGGVSEDFRGGGGRGKSAAERYRNMPDFMKNFRAALTLLWNVSDKSPALCEDAIRKGVVQLLLTDLTDARLGPGRLRDAHRLYIVKAYLAVLTNLVRFHGDARDLFREAGAVKILQQFLKSPQLVVKSKTVMLLSYVINESENDVINASDKHMAFLVKVLQAAVEAENHYARKYGYWAVEVVAGLNRLAAFESNKERIVQKSVLGLYTRLLADTASDEEQILACQGFWVFAFSAANRAAILAEPGCVQALERLEHSGSREETRRTAKGALWVIQQRTSSHGKVPGGSEPTKETKEDSKETPKDKATSAPTESTEAGAASSGDSAPYQPHVMVSYQWSTRLVMSKVRDRLRAAGYKVWMDTDNIALPSLEAMSLAVERAAVVMVCLSQKYKDSPVCRTEAEYALRLQKDIIPLKLQPRYHADGWLGRLVGSKLAFDFTNEDNIDSMMPNLIRELNARGRVRQPPPGGTLIAECGGVGSIEGMRLVAAPSLSSINTAIHVDATMRISAWNVEDVAKWLTDNDLARLTDKFSHVNGELLIEIRKMQHRAPETFYSTVKNELRLDFLSTLKFTRALDRLT